MEGSFLFPSFEQCHCENMLPLNAHTRMHILTYTHTHTHTHTQGERETKKIHIPPTHTSTHPHLPTHPHISTHLKTQAHTHPPTARTETTRPRPEGSRCDEGVEAVSSYGMLFNTGIHIFMYYYYFASAQGRTVWFKVSSNRSFLKPTNLQKYITSAQIIQFITSFLLSIPFFYFYYTTDCTYGMEAFCVSFVCNFIFLVCFIRFYKSSYIQRRKRE